MTSEIRGSPVPSRDPRFLVRLRDQFSNLLARSYVEKSMFVAGATLPFCVLLAVYAQYLHYRPTDAPFLNRDYTPTIVVLASVASLAWVAWACTRRRAA